MCVSTSLPRGRSRICQTLGGGGAIDLCTWSIARRTIPMHLIANQETIDRLVLQGVLLLQAFHAKHYNDPKGNESEFLRGSFAGWRSACLLYTSPSPRDGLLSR